MATTRLALRSSRYLAIGARRPFTTTSVRLAETPPQDFSALNARANDTAEEYRRFQIEKPLNPHMTNTNSTIVNEMPGLGADKAPPELLTNVNPDFVPKDSKPENTKKMTGGTQKGAPDSGPNANLDVGEIEGGSFRVEPLRRSGEDANILRARLLCKRRSLWQSCVLTLMVLVSRSIPEKGHIRVRPSSFHFCERKSCHYVTETIAAIRSLS